MLATRPISSVRRLIIGFVSRQSKSYCRVNGLGGDWRRNARCATFFCTPVAFGQPFRLHGQVELLIVSNLRGAPMSIRALMLGRVALFVFVLPSPASAADLGRPPVVAPPGAFSWTGCYVGGYLGGAGADRDAVFTDLRNSQFRALSGRPARPAHGAPAESTHSGRAAPDS